MEQSQKTIFVTGGAGFIGSALIRYIIEKTDYKVINFDKLTYAGNLASLKSIESSDRYIFEKGDIVDGDHVTELLNRYRPCAIMNLAAESHVDRSIDGAADFIQTNIVGTYQLLDSACAYWNGLNDDEKDLFRFHHISTDEVYGDLGATDKAFDEDHPYAPSSPYSASKASSDHLVRAWGRTYGLPTLITNCSNNYGPYHFPEKLIPHIILNALQGKELPVYGDGKQIRDWLYVEDHANALMTVLEKGSIGETYNIGGNNEKTNIEVVEMICCLLDELVPSSNGESYKELITFVTDRPGHDRRYAIDNSKITHELGWSPQETFETGLEKTVQWYLDNEWWWGDILGGEYDLKRIGASS